MTNFTMNVDTYSIKNNIILNYFLISQYINKQTHKKHYYGNHIVTLPQHMHDMHVRKTSRSIRYTSPWSVWDFGIWKASLTITIKTPPRGCETAGSVRPPVSSARAVVTHVARAQNLHTTLRWVWQQLKLNLEIL